jgi:hypothetical protein
MDKAMKAEIEKIVIKYKDDFNHAEFGDIVQQRHYEKTILSQATSSLTSLIIKWLEEKETGKCDNPRISPKEYVSHEMALDACEPEMEGQIYKEETAERCGECLSCIKDQLITELIGEVR